MEFSEELSIRSYIKGNGYGEKVNLATQDGNFLSRASSAFLFTNEHCSNPRLKSGEEKCFILGQYFVSVLSPKVLHQRRF